MDKKEKDAETSKKILLAARNIFLTKGHAGARMQDIADEAGINKALLHYYYRSKDQLFETIFLEEAKKFFPKINMIFESDQPLFKKIEVFTAEYIDELIANPYLPLFILNQINQDGDRFLKTVMGKALQPRPQLLLQQIEKEVKLGRIRPISPVQLLLNLLSMCIFPFIGKPMIQAKIGLTDPQFKKLMEQRKQEIPAFIIQALKK